mmetsp:Transcript_1676/g.1887  ORF Transcript_1676/g.1887 Transcript_1676/m.1887 type:complete len:116 (-) Transcript_1676:308-655(-)
MLGYFERLPTKTREALVTTTIRTVYLDLSREEMNPQEDKDPMASITCLITRGQRQLILSMENRLSQQTLWLSTGGNAAIAETIRGKTVATTKNPATTTTAQNSNAIEMAALATPV